MFFFGLGNLIQIPGWIFLAAALLAFGEVLGGLITCRIPDDCLDPKRYPLFMGRAVMQELVNGLKAQASSINVQGGTT